MGRLGLARSRFEKGMKLFKRENNDFSFDPDPVKIIRPFDKYITLVSNSVLQMGR